MAEAILRHLSHGSIDVVSAGTEPKPEIHPMARQAVAELLGLDMSDQYPKSLDRFVNREFDYVITVCDRAAESCPMFPGKTLRVHWNFDDPAAATGTKEQQQRAFTHTAQQLLARMRTWLALPALRSRMDAHKAEQPR
jgi:arsenate reductase